MKLINILTKQLVLLGTIILIVSSCEKAVDPVTPTNDLMEGVWKVTEAYDADDSQIVQKVNPLLVASIFDLNSTNGVITTAGPMFMYIVYGKSRFIEIIGEMDQAFKYNVVDFGLTLGEWGIKKGEVVDRFTIEMKMKFPTIQTIENLLQLMGIQIPSLFEEVIYHKFTNVKVTIDDNNPNVMWWEFDDSTVPFYNIKDDQLNFVLWNGVDVNTFTRSKYKLEKQIKGIQVLVDEAYQQFL